MLHMLDLRTLSTLTFIETFCFGLILIFFSLRRGKYPGSLNIGYGIFIISISFLMLSTQKIFHPLISIVAANFVGIVGNCFLSAGFRQFLNFEPSLKTNAVISVVSLAWLFYFSQISENYVMRIAFVSVLNAAILVDVFIVLFFGKIIEIKNICRITSLFFLSAAVSYLIRAFVILSFPDPRVEFLLDSFNPLYYYLNLFHSFIMFVSFIFCFIFVVFMIARRLEADRKRYENELLESRRKLVQINAERDRFFAIIAHDLMSPSFAIPELLGIIMSDYDSCTDDEIKESIAAIYKSSVQICALLENLLTWSRSITGNITFSPASTDIVKLFDSVHLLNAERIRAKSIEIKNLLPSELYACCDSHMIETVIRNIVSNAIKFTPEKGVIAFEGQYTESGIVFSIKNSGAGMSEDIRQKLFKVGERVSRQGTNGEQGTGIGLLIVKEFIDRHGGSITVDSGPDRGCVFKIFLPESKT